MSTMMRITGTPGLLRLIREARLFGFNRRMSNIQTGQLDPEGFHVLTVLVPLMEDGAAHRCRVLLKFGDADEPVGGELDVDVETFEGLMTAKEVRALIAAQEEDPE